MTKLSDYWDLLSRHDWWYMMSDDHAVYKRGHKNIKELEKIAEESAAHKELFNNYQHAINHNTTKPERPSDNG